MTGKIKNVNSAGYGFIETPDKIDFFFHFTEYQGDWKQLLKMKVSNEKMLVEFENDPEAPQGPRALRVKLINTENQLSLPNPE